VKGDLYEPPAYISDYPPLSVRGDDNFVVSLSYSYDELPKFRRLYTTSPSTLRSSYEDSSLTFGSNFYNKGNYKYTYTPRSSDAEKYFFFRRDRLLENNLRKIREQALEKEQRDKRGGLFELNLDIKNKTFESIFGEGGAGLKVAGYHRIEFSGRSQWDDRASTATFRQNKFPSLHMEQISRFDINGNIGSKITVAVSQDSKTTIPLENRLMIRYKGGEDEILKSIEAGNTTLSLPNTRFVGYSSRIQGLFGIKAEAQIGGLSLTAIASQEKGSTERTSLDAGAAGSRVVLRDWEYAQNRIFDLGILGGSNRHFEPTEVIDEIYIYQSTTTNSTVGAEQGEDAKLHVEPDNPELFPNEFRPAVVEEIDANNYFVDKREKWIMFYTSIRPNADVGAYMVVRDTINGNTREIGSLEGDTLSLKLIRHNNPDSSMVSWYYEWRNVYSIRRNQFGSGQVNPEGLEINVFRGEAGTENRDDNLDYEQETGVKYIKILGLDRYNNTSGAVQPDEKVDVNTNIIQADAGLLIFPTREPFATDQTYSGLDPLDPQIPQIYRLRRGHPDIQSSSKYYITVTSRTRDANINLGKPNIIEGSEVITLNGRRLQRGEDYNIQYDFGRVTFLKEEALDPNSSLNIDFEYSPFILAQQKTLFGVRGEYEFSKNFTAGATFLYKSDKATERKPKIGQETSRMMIWDADTKFTTGMNFLTDFANALPLITTDRESQITVSAEMAQSYPDPNIDGVAFLDDFEGSRDAYSLGVYRSNWVISSAPYGLHNDRRRARLVWYNPYNQTATQEIWDREVGTGQAGFSHTLNLIFYPDVIDRRIKTDSDLVNIDSTLSWGGVYRYLPAGAANQDRAQLFEMRVKGGKGVLHIDFGKISEDIDNNGFKTTENTINDHAFFLDPGEDIGLDLMTDEQERAYYVAEAIADSADPSGDNWAYDGETDPYNVSRINGSQGNEQDPETLGRPDTEDFNRNGVLDAQNNYYSFEIDLSDPNDDFFDETSENKSGWKTYRIPIREPQAVADSVNFPSWSQITHVRLWMESPTGEVCTLAVASMDIISSNWEDSLMTTDTSGLGENAPLFNVAVINTQENGGRYDPPPGVTGNYDAASGITEPEQSLVLHYQNFRVLDSSTADTGLVEKFLLDTPNLMGYQKIKMFVKGAPDSSNTDIKFFFRIGADSLNYYEVAQRLEPNDWINSSGWIDVAMDFNEITALKQDLEIAREADSDTNTIVSEDNRYRIFGRPNISRVKYLAMGVINTNPDTVITGDIWVDELRLTDVRRDVGLAGRVSLNGNVADLFNYNFSYDYENSFFRRISSSTRGGGQNNLGSGRTTSNLSAGVSFSFDKFLPRALGANIPVSFRYGESRQVPRLKFQSDIILPEEDRSDESTINVTRSLSVSESFSKRTKNPIFTVFLNNQRINFSYNQSEGRSPSRPMTFSESYRISSSYNFTIKKVPYIEPFFWTQPIPLLKKLSESKFYFFPESFNAKANLNRSFNMNRNSKGTLTNNLSRDFTGDLQIGYKISNELRANYSYSTRRDMTDPSSVNLSFNPKDLKLGLETDYRQAFSATYKPAVFSWLTHSLSFTTNYRDNLNVANNTLNMSSTKSYGINGSFDINRMFGGGNRSRSRRPSRRNVVNRDKEKGVTVAEKEKGFFETIIDPPASVMRFLTSWIEPVSYDFKQSQSYSYVGLTERARAQFRFGFTEDIGAEIDPEVRATGRTNAVGRSISYGLGSGTRFLGGIQTDIRFNRAIREDVVKSVNPQKTEQTTFPDISFSIRELKTFKFLNPLIRKFNPRTKFSRDTDETINLTTGHTTKEQETISYNPLISVDFNLVRGLSLNFRLNRSITEDKTFQSTNGSLLRTSKNTQNNIAVQTRYSFSWPTGVKLPILGTVKFKSQVSMSVDVSMRKSKRESSEGDGPLVSEGERSNFEVRPSVSYSFSNQIKGGLTGLWQDTKDMVTRRNSHVRELRIWVEIRF